MAFTGKTVYSKVGQVRLKGEAIFHLNLADL
jgi:hypothetical protein